MTGLDKPAEAAGAPRSVALYDLARAVFMADKKQAANPAAEWENARPENRDYAYAIAGELLARGYARQQGDRAAAVLEVTAAWQNPGPVPTFHRAAQDRLRRDWPVLAGALARLAGR